MLSKTCPPNWTPPYSHREEPMPLESTSRNGHLTGHALRNLHLRERSLKRSQSAPPLARALVRIRADILGMTRLEFVRRSGISRGTLRDLELGVHVPTRRTLQQFVGFCEKTGVDSGQLEEVRRLYAGPGDTLQELIARLELQAGSPRELARRVAISPESLWYEAERQRFLDRGYPAPLAEFWVLCARSNYAEKHLTRLGMSTATVRHLRYLEMPPWNEVAETARQLCRDAKELQALERLWRSDDPRTNRPVPDLFGPRLKEKRKRLGIGRRD